MKKERSVASLRKFGFVILVILLAFVCTAALADTEYSLSPAAAKVTLKDNRTIVTSESLEQHPELLTVLGMSKDDVLADWQSRGVILQSWLGVGKTKYSCIEITVAKDDDSAQNPDLISSGNCNIRPGIYPGPVFCISCDPD